METIEPSRNQEAYREVFFLDMDGCIASQRKVWYEDISETLHAGETGISERQGTIGVYKQISDHDSWLIDSLKNKVDIIIISNDKRVNAAWAQRRGVPFIHTASANPFVNKWDYLKDYWEKTYKGSPGGNYFYLGDAVPDLKCMRNSKMAFYPSDASIVLKEKTKQHPHIVELGTKSGEGAFESMIHALTESGLIRSDLL